MAFGLPPRLPRFAAANLCDVVARAFLVDDSQPRIDAH